MARRWWPLLAIAAALLAWLAWPEPDGAAQEPATGSRRAPPATARRAAPLATAPAQPATSTFGARRTGIAACDDLVDRTMTCAQLPDNAKIAVAEASKAWARVEGASRPDLEASCRATASVQGDALTAMGC
jgi:hypothetical protein